MGIYVSSERHIYNHKKRGYFTYVSGTFAPPLSFAEVGLRDTSIASMLSILNVNKGSSLVITMSMLMAQIVAALIGGLYAIKKSIEKT